MSRSGYTDDCEGSELHLYRGAVTSAMRGRRGQKFFCDLIAALDAMPAKRLVASELETETGEVCALGSLGRMRGVDMAPIDPEDAEGVASTFDIAECLARETVFENDERDAVDVLTCPRCLGSGLRALEPEPDTPWQALQCGACWGGGQKRRYRRETPEERWARMRTWAESNIARLP